MLSSLSHACFLAIYYINKLVLIEALSKVHLFIQHNIIINENKRYSRTAKELYNAVKKRTKNKEEEKEPAHCQENRRLVPAHFLDTPHTTDTGSEQPEEEEKQMNDISYQ